VSRLVGSEMCIRDSTQSLELAFLVAEMLRDH
jgi:hypothetical protein